MEIADRASHAGPVQTATINFGDQVSRDDNKLEAMFERAVIMVERLGTRVSQL